MPAPDAMSIDTLYKLIGTPRAPLILDARDAGDYPADARNLPGAVALLAADPVALVVQAGGGPVVVQCQKGKKRAQGIAALLRCEGVEAEYLEGGFLAWRDAGLPMVRRAGVPMRDAAGATLWVTRNRPKVDRIACAWLVRRFVDRRARFLFVAPAEVLDVAKVMGATAFDVEGAPLTHAGDLCTFDAMHAHFGLSHPALIAMAPIIRGADTGAFDLAPQAAGLLALSLGLSRQFSNDLEQLEAGLALYDALFRWARDAQAEVHGWTTKT